MSNLRLVLALIVGCNSPASNAAPAPGAPAPHRVAAPLTEPQARERAAKLATDAFKARTDLHHPDGSRVLPTFDPKDFRGGLVGARWKLEILRPAGANAQVSFGRAGEDPKVEISYADE